MIIIWQNGYKKEAEECINKQIRLSEESRKMGRACLTISGLTKNLKLILYITILESNSNIVYLYYD
jgi:hypothetical protein